MYKIFLCVVLCFFSSIGHTKIKVSADDNNIYFRLTLRELSVMEALGYERPGTRHDLALKAIQVSQKKIAKLFVSKQLPFTLDHETIEALTNKSTDSLKGFVDTLNQYLDKNTDNPELGRGWSYPSAFIFGVGVKASSNVLVGPSGEGSLTIGFVAMPTFTYVVPRFLNNVESIDNMTEMEVLKLIQSQTSKSFNRISCEFEMFAAFNVGAGMAIKGNVTPVTMGTRFVAGFIMGDMNSASDFKGHSLGGSVHASLFGLGWKGKAGVVSNPDLKGRFQFFYTLLGYETETAVGVSAHVGYTNIVTGNKVLELFGLNFDHKIEEIPKTNQVEQSKPELIDLNLK